MKKAIISKEMYWHDIADSFPDMSKEEAFKTTIAEMVRRGLMQHPPSQDMTAWEWKKFRSDFMRKGRNRANK